MQIFVSLILYLYVIFSAFFLLSVFTFTQTISSFVYPSDYCHFKCYTIFFINVDHTVSLYKSTVFICSPAFIYPSFYLPTYSFLSIYTVKYIRHLLVQNLVFCQSNDDLMFVFCHLPQHWQPICSSADIRILFLVLLCRWFS